MKNLVLLSILFLAACTSAIKDEKSEKENPAKFEAVSAAEEYRPEPTKNLEIQSKEDLIGYWVGWFEPDAVDSLIKREYTGEYNPWRSANKINISIDSFENDSVFGHSVVANNYRQFKGQVKIESGVYTFECEEPGDHSHDGVFHFTVISSDSFLSGVWEANGKLEYPNRKYRLSKKIYKYNASNTLSGRFIDWENYNELLTLEEETAHYDSLTIEQRRKAVSKWYDIPIYSISDEDLPQYIEEMIMVNTEYDKEYFGTTYDAMQINASSTLLTQEQVENLTKADIYVLRNSIYARHGYSFKKRQLRAFFDRQEWYIPVHANIKSDLTEIEKKNIQLLLKYEEHAEEYYDEFGRG